MNRMGITKSQQKVVFVIGSLFILALAAYMAFLATDEPVYESTVIFVTSSEARIKIKEHQDVFILDVRSNEEFVARRIPGAVNIPYTMIRARQDLLPGDRQAQIMVYCRTGRRAAIAANELLALGYINVIVFPGMVSWDYETVTG